ncbi:hypothetical protein L7F22_017999 [Adiantum nelumboides]|nr:hypothetical protein [Adiantum nelumboides]
MATRRIPKGNDGIETERDLHHHNEETDFDRGQRDTEAVLFDTSARSSRRRTTERAQRRAHQSERSRREEEDFTDTSRKSKLGRDGSRKAKHKYHKQWVTKTESDIENVIEESDHSRWRMDTGRTSRRKEKPLEDGIPLLPIAIGQNKDFDKLKSGTNTANNEEVVSPSEKMYEYCNNDEVNSNPTAEMTKKWKKINKHLKKELTDKAWNLFLKFKDVFAWEHNDLKGVDLEFSRRMENSGSMWTYRKLNAQSIKDPFPLPFTDMMLDEIAGHEMYSFMDGYSGYNQLKIAPEDKEKTTFITKWGTFMYQLYKARFIWQYLYQVTASGNLPPPRPLSISLAGEPKDAEGSIGVANICGKYFMNDQINPTLTYNAPTSRFILDNETVQSFNDSGVLAIQTGCNTIVNNISQMMAAAYQAPNEYKQELEKEKQLNAQLLKEKADLEIKLTQKDQLVQAKDLQLHTVEEQLKKAKQLCKDTEFQLLYAEQAKVMLHDQNQLLGCKLETRQKQLDLKEEQLTRAWKHKELIDQSIMNKYLLQTLQDINTPQVNITLKIPDAQQWMSKVRTDLEDKAETFTQALVNEAIVSYLGDLDNKSDEEGDDDDEDKADEDHEDPTGP